jgi:MoxR-like ATPase
MELPMPGLIQSVTLVDAYNVARQPGVRHILLAGPPGVGKTTFCFELATLLKLDAWKVQFHAESTPAEIYGMYVPGSEGQGFEWMPGPLDMAYTKGGMLILDEIVEASGPCKTALYGALDEGKGGVIDYVGRQFKPNKKYKAAATMNGWPMEGGLPEALLDRFDAVFIITQPGPKQLERLDPDLRKMCAEAYERAPDPMLGPIITYRTMMAFQKLRATPKLSLEKAALFACKGDEKQTKAFLEVLAMQDTDEPEDEDDEIEDEVDPDEIEDEIEDEVDPDDDSEDEEEDDDDEWDDDD